MHTSVFMSVLLLVKRALSNVFSGKINIGVHFLFHFLSFLVTCRRRSRHMKSCFKINPD